MVTKSLQTTSGGEHLLNGLTWSSPAALIRLCHWRASGQITEIIAAHLRFQSNIVKFPATPD